MIFKILVPFNEDYYPVSTGSGSFPTNYPQCHWPWIIPRVWTVQEGPKDLREVDFLQNSKGILYADMDLDRCIEASNIMMLSVDTRDWIGCIPTAHKLVLEESGGLHRKHRY